MKRKQHSEHENHERWLVSYADFITLLFAFFVVMFASSQADKGKAQQVSESVKRAIEDGPHASALIATILGGAADQKGKGSASMRGPGGAIKPVDTPPQDQKAAQLVELLPSLKILSEELKKEITAGKLQVSMQARGLTISFAQAALFPSGEDTVSSDAYESLEKIASAIRKVPNPVRLEGHTDAVPIRTSRFKSNWDLSAARSIAILEHLSTHGAVAPGKLSIAGYADTAPVDTNDTEAGRARNRRVDIIILNETGVLGEPAKPIERRPLNE
ncbi:MAG: flagellar motor protein MotB [Bryobacteraceae bacterium]